MAKKGEFVFLTTGIVVERAFEVAEPLIVPGGAPSITRVKCAECSAVSDPQGAGKGKMNGFAAL